jgi:hypothetical protein
MDNENIDDETDVFGLDEQDEFYGFGGESNQSRSNANFDRKQDAFLTRTSTRAALDYMTDHELADYADQYLAPEITSQSLNVPAAYLNYTIPWNLGEDEETKELLDNFVPDTSPEKYNYDEQVMDTTCAV